MKLIFAAILALGLGMTIAAPSSAQEDCELKNDLAEFMDLIPMSRIKSIAIRYYLFDREFRQFVKYLRSKEFEAVVADVVAHPVIVDLAEFVEELCSSIQFIDLLNLDFLQDPSVSIEDMVADFSVKKFVKEVLGVIPFDEMSALADRKMEESSDFRAFVEKLASLKYEDVIDIVTSSEHVTAFVKRLERYGLDIEGARAKLEELLQ